MGRPMKDSGIKWIGEMPQDWKVCRLKDIKADKKYAIVDGPFGTAISTSDYVEDGIPLLRILNLGTSSIDKNNLMHITPEHASSVSRSAFGIGDIIFAKTGATIGKCAINDDIEYGILSSSCVKISISDILCKKYYYYFFNTLTFNQALRLACVGTTRDTINLSPFSCLPCIMPTIHEQQRIADFLDKQCVEIDAVIEKTRESIEEYKKLKQAVITQAVTKGIRGNRPMKDSGVDWIGQIPENWIVCKIKYAAYISRGLFNHRPRNDERFYGGCYPFIQTGDVAQANKYITSYSQTLNELGIYVSKQFPKGTLTMTIAANVGDVAILGFNAYFPDSVVGFIPNVGVSDLYLYYIFKAMKEEFVRTAIKSTQLNLNIERVKELYIPITKNIDEQKEIEEYLELKTTEIDKLIKKKEDYLSEIESYKKSLIYEYVTGKKEVV